jgi:hypothetical protein
MDLHLTEHASLHMGAQRSSRGRTALSYNELKTITAKKTYASLGIIAGTDFRLVWDNKLGRGIILLVSYDTRFKNEVLVTIWDQDFTIDHRLTQVTPELIAQARKLYEEKTEATQAT